MPWINKAKAVIQSWYAGQEYGNALVDVLTGTANPSGKLPTTFPINLSDTPAFDPIPVKIYKWIMMKNYWWAINGMTRI